MGIRKISIDRNYCVIAYAVLCHSVHSPVPARGIPGPSIGDSVFCTLLF